LLARSRKLDIVFVSILAVVLLFGFGFRVGYSWTGNTNTLSPGFIEFVEINASDYYFRSLNRSQIFQGNYTNIGLYSPWLNLNGVNRSTWPAGGGVGGIDAYDFSYLLFANATGYYSINGTTGQIDYSGGVFDTVCNNTLLARAMRMNGGKLVISAGNYTRSTNSSILIPSNTEIELPGGTIIWVQAPTTNGSIVFRNMNSSNNNIVIHGDGVLDGNKNQMSATTRMTAIQLDACTQSKVDLYIQHFRGFNLVDNKGGDDANNIFINRYYPDAGVKISKPVHQMIQAADSWLIDNCSHGWTATFGWLNYSTDYMEANFSMKGSAQGAGAERLRLVKTWTTPLDLENCNLGFWLKSEGDLSNITTLTIYLEIWDVHNVARQFRWSAVEDELNGSDDVWSFHIFPYNNFVISNAINMSEIDDMRFRFLADDDGWNVSIDEFTAFPIQRSNPNGAVIFTFDGPYPHQWQWAYTAMNRYGYKGNIATSYDIPGESPGNGGTYLANLTKLYDQGWDICVYSRAFDGAVPPRPLSEAEILDFALRQKQWLLDNDFIRSADYLHANQHLGDVYTYDLLSDYFIFQKALHVSSVSSTALPTMYFYGGATTYANDYAAI